MFVCQECNAVFSSKKSLSSHLNWHNEKYKEKCSKTLFGIKKYSNKNQEFENQKRISDYYLNPKTCLYCKDILVYQKRYNKFCSSSCSAIFNRTGKIHSKDTKQKIKDKLKNKSPSNKGTKIKNRVYFKNCVICNNLFCTPKPNRKSCSDKCSVLARGGSRFKNIKYKNVFFDSSWEVKVAQQLDENDIKWTRPKGLTYTNDQNKLKKYVPDFYLPDYDVYLDPKNEYVRFLQKQKLKDVDKYLKIKLILLNKSQLSWDKIQKLILS